MTTEALLDLLTSMYGPLTILRRGASHGIRTTESTDRDYVFCGFETQEQRQIALEAALAGRVPSFGGLRLRVAARVDRLHSQYTPRGPNYRRQSRIELGDYASQIFSRLPFNRQEPGAKADHADNHHDDIRSSTTISQPVDETAHMPPRSPAVSEPDHTPAYTLAKMDTPTHMMPRVVSDDRSSAGRLSSDSMASPSMTWHKSGLWRSGSQGSFRYRNGTMKRRATTQSNHYQNSPDHRQSARRQDEQPMRMQTIYYSDIIEVSNLPTYMSPATFFNLLAPYSASAVFIYPETRPNGLRVGEAQFERFEDARMVCRRDSRPTCCHLLTRVGYQRASWCLVDGIPARRDAATMYDGSEYAEHADRAGPVACCVLESWYVWKQWIVVSVLELCRDACFIQSLRLG
ncbi:hypothetical protein PYCC9005_001611 [Savitreella phatthalungensis]